MKKIFGLHVTLMFLTDGLELARKIGGRFLSCAIDESVNRLKVFVQYVMRSNARNVMDVHYLRK